MFGKNVLKIPAVFSKLKGEKWALHSILRSLWFPEIVFVLLIAPTKLTFVQQRFLAFPIPLDLLIYGLLLILIMVQIIRGRGLPYIPARLLLPYLGLGCIMLVSLTYTPDFEYGKDKVSEFFTITTLACFGPFFLFRKMANIKRFLYAIVGIGFLLVIVLFESNPYLYFHSIHFETKLGSNYLLIQHISAMGFLIILYGFFLTKQSLMRKIGSMFLWVVLLCAILYCPGKGTILTLFITTIILAILSLALKNRFGRMAINNYLVGFPLILIIAVLCIFIFWVSVADYSVVPSAQFWRFRNVLSSQHYSQIERLENAKIAFNLWTQNPLIGEGIGSFRVHSFKIEGIEPFKYPHSIVLEILAELGSIGFIFFALIIFFAFRNLIKLQNSYGSSLLPRIFMSLFLFALLNSLLSQDITNPVLFAYVGASFAIEKSMSNNEEHMNEQLVHI